MAIPVPGSKLQTKEVSATTVTWTLYTAQLLNGSVNSPPFTANNVSFRLCGIHSGDQDVGIHVEAAEYCGSYFLRYSIETEDGDLITEVQNTVDFSKGLRMPVVLPFHCDEWLRWLGDSRVMRLIFTFLPEYPCHSRVSLPFWSIPSELQNVHATCKRNVHPSVDEKCRGELHQMTQPAVEVVWTVRFPCHRISHISETFHLGSNSFQLILFGGDTNSSVRLAYRGGKEILTSLWFTVQESNDKNSLRFFVSRLQLLSGGSHECFNMNRKTLLRCLERDYTDNVDLKIVCSVIQENKCMRRVGREGLNKVLKDFSELLQTGQDSDLIVEVEGEKFQVHKAILGIRCPFFANVLKHDMVEKSTGVVKIPDYTPEEFKDILLYLYTARVDSFTPEKALSLYRAADQYDLPDLRADSLEFIKRNLSVDTLGDVIALSHKYKEAELLELATRFFTINLLAVIKTDSWKMFGKENFDEANEMHIKALESTALKTPT